jgi:lipopolysaccharide exporter
MAPQSLTGTLFGGLRWNMGGVVAQALVQFAFGIALARILGPLPFGTMAVAWAVIMPAATLTDAGLGLALVQSEKVGVQEIKFCFRVQSCLGAVLALVICIFSPKIAAFFSAPDLPVVLAALSTVIFIQALGLTAVNMLRRSIDFRRLQIVQLCALICSQLLLALPLALAGAGVWSLVAAAIASAVITSAVAYAIVRHEIGLGCAGHDFGLGRTAKWYLLLNLVNAVHGMLPQIAIGHFFGSAGSGLYDRAYSLIVAPIDRGAQAVSGVLFSFFARTNDDGAKQRDLFLGWLTVAGFFGAPCAAVIALHSDLIVAVTLGPKWTAAGELLPALSVCILLFLVLETSVPILNGRGRPDIELGIVVAMICLFLPAVFLAHGSVKEIVWGLVAVYAFRVGCLLISVRYVVRVRFTLMLSAIFPGLVAAALLLAGNMLLAAGLPMTLPDTLRLAVIVLGSTASLVSIWSAYYVWMPDSAFPRALRV